MVTLRNFSESDAKIVQKMRFKNMSLEDIIELFRKWNELEYESRYYEMFAVLYKQNIVGQISLYQHSQTVISCGPEIYDNYRKQGYAVEAMTVAMDIAKEKGYRIVMQQVRTDNVASIALHQRLGFETDGYVYQNKKGNEVVIYIKALM